MRISIVTLSYNQRCFLREAIESILQQGYLDLEYIVVDPGSNDGSRELIKSYGSQLSKVIFENDRGAADGLNKGFALATGDVFGFINADDFLLPDALRRVNEFFESHPRCDLAMGNGYIMSGHAHRQRHVRARDFTVQRYLYGGARWLQQSTFFRREVFLRSTGFNIENHTCWDGELFVSMATMGAIIDYIEADLAVFRIHNLSISGMGTNKKSYQEECLRIFRQIRGRDWNAADEILRFFYRGEGLLRRVCFG
jgi:glycosyltransferase involved in cell wall biosynthesis